jgi:hypothetical protein
MTGVHHDQNPMRAARAVKKMPLGGIDVQRGLRGEAVRVDHGDAVVVARADPHRFAARREFHVQHRLAGLQRLHDR